MKSYRNKGIIILVMTMLLALSGYHCSSGRKAPKDEPYQTIKTNIGGKGAVITLTFTKGEAHNHPLMAIWIEDTLGNYLETLYISESIGKGVFQHGNKSGGTWKAGPVRRPAALPYWGHKWGVRAPDGYFIPTPEDPMPDAVTGPTPAGNFILESRAADPAPQAFNILLEINQSWDWNEFWTNSMHTEDEQYKTSSQPSVVYAAKVVADPETHEYEMKPIGHGHYSGKDGELYKDLGTLTTALDIVKSAKARISH